LESALGELASIDGGKLRQLRREKFIEMGNGTL
jgi:hypothetical protein